MIDILIAGKILRGQLVSVKITMAQSGLLCAHVLLGNYSLSHL